MPGVRHKGAVTADPSALLLPAPSRKSRRRIATARTPIPKPEGPNSRWSVDFARNQLADGQRFRVLNIIDDVTKEWLASDAKTLRSGKRLVRKLKALIARHGRLGVSGNGTEYSLAAVLKLTQGHKLGWCTVAPDNPTQNAFTESVQRPDARRVPERAAALLDEAGPSRDPRLGPRPKQGAPALVPRLLHLVACALTLYPKRA